MAAITLVPTKDVYVSEWYADENFDESIALFVSQYKQPGDDYRSLLKFDLSSIPPTSTICRAVLELKVFRNEVTCGIRVQAHRLLNRWHECTVTWDSQPPVYPYPDGSEFVPAGEPPEYVCIDITTLVRGWYEGSVPNEGLVLIGNEAENDLLAFVSTRGTYSYEWPRLCIDYVVGVLNYYPCQRLCVPKHECPYIESAAIPLGPTKKATFLIVNTCEADHVEVLLQVGNSPNPNEVFFDVGDWCRLQPAGFPGEAVSLSTNEAADFARVLIKGRGGETVIVYPRTKEL